MAIFPANATIIFEQPATASRIGINGTPETTTTPLIVVASLGEMVSRANSDQQLRDVDYFQIQLTGRAVTPKALPNTIKPGTTGQCLYWRLTSSFAAANEANIIQRGVFYLRADLGSKFKVQQILGDKITGSLTTQVAWDEVS
jgi:hypothetical protein